MAKTSIQKVVGQQSSKSVSAYNKQGYYYKNKQARFKKQRIINSKPRTNIRKRLIKKCQAQDIIMKYIVNTAIEHLFSRKRFNPIVRLYCLQLILNFEFIQLNQLRQARQIACCIFQHAINTFGKGNKFGFHKYCKQFSDLDKEQFAKWSQITQKKAQGILILDLIKQNNKNRIISEILKLMRRSVIASQSYDEQTLEIIMTQLRKTTRGGGGAAMCPVYL